MGLHAAAKAGAKVDAEIWQKIRDYFADTQKQDGGWTYHNAGDQQLEPDMTVAALLGLTVAAKYDKEAKGPDPAFEKGMAAARSAESWANSGKGKSYVRRVDDDGRTGPRAGDDRVQSR